MKFTTHLKRNNPEVTILNMCVLNIVARSFVLKKTLLSLKEQIKLDTEGRNC
jgi:hypothetical protein